MKARHWFRNWLRGLFGAAAPVARPDLPASFATTPLELPAWAAWAQTAEPAASAKAATRVRTLARPLAAQLASQARLNVPVSRKASTKATSLKSAPAKAKRAVTPRSVHLQARHLAPKRVQAQPLPTLKAAATLSTYTRPRSLDLAA